MNDARQETLAEPSGEPERRFGSVLKSTVLGRRRVTAVVNGFGARTDVLGVPRGSGRLLSVVARTKAAVYPGDDFACLRLMRGRTNVCTPDATAL